MKVSLTFTDMVMLKAVLDYTPWTNTNIAKILYGIHKENIQVMINNRNRVIGEAEEETEEEQEVDGKKKKIKVKKVPQEKISEVNQNIENLLQEVEISDIVAPALKLAINNFPNIVVDKQTWEKGIKWEGDIFAYETLKLKFN